MGKNEKIFHKKIFLSIGLLVIICTILMMPYIKLLVYTHNYELIGTYIIFDKKDINKITDPIQLSTVSKDYTDKSIQITNILYYKELKQLSFGFIKDNESNYDVKIVHNGNEIGKLMTAGTLKYYNKSIERIYSLFDEYLLEDEEYTIQVMNSENTIVGTMKISLPES